MKKIITVTSILIVLIAASLALVFMKVEGESATYDLKYSKLSSSKQGSIIIGTSRPAQGIDPLLVDGITSPVIHNQPLYNFSFNLGCSPFGPAYYRAIEKKITKGKGDSIRVFVISVDPWAVSDFTEDYQPEGASYYEDLTFMGKINQVEGTPNYDYLMTSFRRPLYSIFISGEGKPKVRKMGAYFDKKHVYSEDAIDKHITAKMKFYKKEQLNKKKFSQTRYDYFEKTIELLNQYGQVIILRMPVSKEMHDLEEKYMPEFEEMVKKTSDKYELPFYNPYKRSGEYLSVDGNHLYGSGVKTFSKELGLYINKVVKNKENGK
jgi:hypothetical protein